MNRIKEIRSKSGLSQKGFSEYFNIPVKTIQQWEGGRANPPIYLENLLLKVLEYESEEIKCLKEKL